MKRLYLFATQLAGNTTKHAAAIKALLPYAVLRVLRRVLSDSPVELIISANVLEWAVALLGFVFILRRQLIKHTENDNA